MSGSHRSCSYAHAEVANFARGHLGVLQRWGGSVECVISKLQNTVEVKCGWDGCLGGMGVWEADGCPVG